jgi:hypothetical protein
VSDFSLTIDSREIRRVFGAYPVAATRRLMSLIEGAAIDTQREMRKNVNVGATGDTRRSIRYTTSPANLSATISPNVPNAEALEYGSRPHWTSVRPGTPLYRWATFKGISPYAVQRSIAKKGPQAHPFVQPTYRTMRPKVQRDVIAGVSKFIDEVNNGIIG